MPENSPDIIQSADGLVADVRSMIEQTREGVARAVNSGMTLLYWRIGKRIQAEVLHNQRAEYGKEIVATVSQELTRDFGNGFSAKNLHHMLKFAESFRELEIVSTLSRQLSWSHFKEIIYFKEPLQRDFYAEMCRVERWSVRTLRQNPRLELDQSGIHVAEYLTALPSREVLQQKLHTAIERSRARFEPKGGEA
ncbi:MAG: hypothetical protein GVY36_09325 [Verrucomicrobia bacterium]|jgi:hypothetical protein|nr:hypothetical protein [Verrucomicrobiota bacterium]